MKLPLIGYAEEHTRPLHLTTDSFDTHLHGVGASRTGKSKLIEWIARELIRSRQGFCLIDPHGFLYQDVLRWLTYVQPNRDIILFDPSRQDRVVGFNPFRRAEGDISVQVDRRVQATMKVWGQASTDETPRLERWLKCFYHVLIEQGHSLEIASCLFKWKQRQQREFLVRAVRDPLVREEWEDLYSAVRPSEFWDQVESTHNRLFRFLMSPTLRRVMGLPHNNLNIREIIEGGKILLVNLQPSPDTLSEENARLIGTLLLNEIWEVSMRRTQTPTGGAPSPYILILDEFQRFLTPDIPHMLNEGAKYGLHLMLFHQHLGQLRAMDEQIYNAVMTNARTKLVFGGLTREDARIMAENMFPGQIDLARVKFLLEQTKFWPVYGRDTVHYSGTASGSAQGSMSGGTWDTSLGEWNASYADTSGTSESMQEGMADIPIFRPVPFREVSSITAYSLEESLWELSDRLMEQYQRHFMVRLPGRKTLAAVTPFVKSWYVAPERLRAWSERRLAAFLTTAQVDHALQAIREELQKRAQEPSSDQEPPSARRRLR